MFSIVVNPKSDAEVMRRTVRTSVIPGNSGDPRGFINWMQRGLVCLKSDKEATEYAEKCYAENRSHL